MRNTWLVLDCFFLGWRAYHSKHWMQFGSIRTGVIYGLLQDIIQLQDSFDTNRLVFTFDVGRRKRNEVLPTYKEHRHKDLTPEEEANLEDFRKQMVLLRKSYLPRIGYQNILFAPGFEADDIIASVCRNLPEEDEAVIISADNDLLQLLAPNVLIHNPNTHKTVTLQSFKKAHGIEPKLWSKVKAIAGCKGDGVPGVRGVGEKTALKFILGQLKPDSKAQRDIVEQWQSVVLRNKALVKLPFEGTPTFELREDKLSAKGWAEVAKELGLASLADRLPLAGRQARRPRLMGHSHGT